MPDEAAGSEEDEPWDGEMGEAGSGSGEDEASQTTKAELHAAAGRQRPRHAVRVAADPDRGAELVDEPRLAAAPGLPAHGPQGVGRLLGRGRTALRT